MRSPLGLPIEEKELLVEVRWMPHHGHPSIDHLTSPFGEFGHLCCLGQVQRRRRHYELQ